MRQRRAYLFRKSVVTEVGFCLLLVGQETERTSTFFYHVKMAGIKNKKYVGLGIG